MIELSAVQITTKLGELWKNASEKEKKVYLDQHEELKKERDELIKEEEAKGVVFVSRLTSDDISEENIFLPAEELFIEENFKSYKRDHPGILMMLDFIL